MKANEEKQAEEAKQPPQDAATLFKTLLDKAVTLTDPVDRAQTLAQVAALSQQATERAKMEISRRNEVTIGDDGQLVASNLAGLTEIGKFYAQSDLVPDHYKGNVGNCAIAFQMAKRMKLDPLTFMQQSYLVHGRPGIQAKLYIALLNTSPRLSGRLWYKVERDAAGNVASCIACANDAEGALHESVPITPAMVKAEGWDKDKGTQISKWKTIPEQMYRYRAASFLGNSDFPDVTLGLSTVEELEDVAGEHATGGNGSGNWVQPSSGAILGTGKPLTVAAPAAESTKAVQTPRDENPADATPAQEIQPEYVEASGTARQELPEHTTTDAPSSEQGGKVDGYLTAIGMANTTAGVENLVAKAGQDQSLNDAQFELVKSAAEKRKVNLATPAGPNRSKAFVDKIRAAKSPADVKKVVELAQTQKLTEADMDAVLAEAAQKTQKLSSGGQQPLLK